jgi:hypothetical protein
VGDPAERRRADEARDARLEHGPGYVEAPQRDPVPAQGQGRHRPGLAYACIAPSLDSNEFFLRKAIGWALREYAKTDAGEVRRYVARNAARLSGLSRREALKTVGAG